MKELLGAAGISPRIPGVLSGVHSDSFSAPGALDFSTVAAFAQLGAMPMILLTGRKAIMSGKQARFQIVDVIASMKPLTRMARRR